MKLIHTADLHLDSECSTLFSREQAKTRRNDLLRTFNRMVDYAAEEGVEAILISGDLFDRKTVSKTTANTVIQAVKTHPGITFFYLRGNHDAKGFTELFGELPENLKLFSDTWTSYRIGRAQTVVVTGVELSALHPEIYDTLSLAPEDVNLVMLHGQESQTAGKNDGEVIRLKALRGRFIDYLALGHIHSFKREELDARGIYVYPGTPEGHGFDECGEKGFVLLDVDEEEKTVDSYFVPFTSRILYGIQADISTSSGTAEIIEKVEEALRDNEVPEGGIVRVSLTGEYDAEGEKDLPFIEDSFKDRYEVFRVRDESRLRVDYKRYEGDQTLKGEFIRLVESQDMPEERKAMIIRTGIRALRGEADES